MWFDFYKRRVANDSSGFEHVFIGEIMRKGESKLVVGGLHNWVNYYYNEQFGNVNYKGFIYDKKTEVSRNGREVLSDNWANYYYHEKLGNVDYSGYFYNERTKVNSSTIIIIMNSFVRLTTEGTFTTHSGNRGI